MRAAETVPPASCQVYHAPIASRAKVADAGTAARRAGIATTGSASEDVERSLVAMLRIAAQYSTKHG